MWNAHSHTMRTLWSSGSARRYLKMICSKNFSMRSQSSIMQCLMGHLTEKIVYKSLIWYSFKWIFKIKQITVVLLLATEIFATINILLSTTNIWCDSFGQFLPADLVHALLVCNYLVCSTFKQGQWSHSLVPLDLNQDHI